MALTKYHLLWGILGYISLTALYLGIFPDEEIKEGLYQSQTISDVLTSVSWLFVAVVMAISGSIFADLDHSIWGLHHRDVVTHSALIPGVVTLATFASDFADVKDVDLMFLVLPPFMLAYGLHLFADLWPTVDLSRLKKEGGVVKNTAFLGGWFVTGATSAELTHMLQGTYLIHFWWKSPVARMKNGKVAKWEMRKTLPKHQTRLWLIGNCLICLGCCAVLVAKFVQVI